MLDLLQVNNLSYSYKEKQIFENLQFSIKKSSLNLILGSNSSGKTTLIRLLTGILPSNDCISIDDIKLNKNNLHDYLLSFGTVFFDCECKFLFDTVKEELSFPLENLNYKKKEIEKRIEEVSNILNIYDCIDKKVNELTNFEQAKVLIAVSILHNPKIIFLDNPLKKLSMIEQKNIVELLNKIKKDITVCITSSKLDNVLMFDNILVLGNGNIAMQGKPLDIINKDNELAKLGINIPSMIDLSIKLQFYGILKDEVVTEVDRMVDKLWN